MRERERERERGRGGGGGVSLRKVILPGVKVRGLYKETQH